MPSVRTDSQPMNVAAIVAMNTARITAIHHGQPRLISTAALVPKIAML